MIQKAAHPGVRKQISWTDFVNENLSDLFGQVTSEQVRQRYRNLAKAHKKKSGEFKSRKSRATAGTTASAAASAATASSGSEIGNKMLLCIVAVKRISGAMLLRCDWLGSPSTWEGLRCAFVFCKPADCFRR